MERLTYTERYVDEDENYCLPNVAQSKNFEKVHFSSRSEQRTVLGFSESFDSDEILNRRFVITSEENGLCSDLMASQTKPHNVFRNADVTDVHLDFNEAISDATDDGKTMNACASSKFEKVELLSENLSKMISSFKKCKESCSKFLEIYPSWSEKREKVIAQLKETSERLDKIKFDSNVAKVVGSSVGIAGGVLTAVGAALTPLTMGLSTPLTIEGIVTSSLGGVTSLGTAVTELCLLANKIKIARKIVQKDKEEFNVLAELFDHAGAYMRALEDFVGLDPVAKVVNALELCNVATGKSVTSHTSRSSTSRKILALEASGIQKKVLDIAKAILPPTLHGIAVPLSLIIAVVANPNLSELLQEMRQLHHDNPVIYEIITIIYRIQILTLADMQANCVSCVNTAAKFGTITVSATVGQTISSVLFAGLSIAIDVMSLTLTSINLHKGSYCHSAECVRKVNEQLTSEFDIVKSVYTELKQM